MKSLRHLAQPDSKEIEERGMHGAGGTQPACGCRTEAASAGPLQHAVWGEAKAACTKVAAMCL